MYKKSIHLTLITLLGLILTSTASAELVGWWKFDNNNGTVAIDSSGYDHDGIITNATWEAGRYGSALGFDGTAYVDVSPEAWASIETQVTVAFWVYADETPPNNFIFGAYIDPAINIARIASAHVPWGGQVYWDTSGNLDTWDPDRINKGTQDNEYLGAWHHWAFVKNAETGQQEIYLD